MKKIINGKVYDTQTAKYLGYYTNNQTSDLDQVDIRLYVKRTGEYFICGEGGPRTRYAVYNGDQSYSSGWAITPLSYDQAQDWAAEHLDADEYIRILGDPGEGEEGTEILSVSLPKDVAAKIRRAAQQEGMTLSGYIAAKMSV